MLRSCLLNPYFYGRTDYFESITYVLKEAAQLKNEQQFPAHSHRSVGPLEVGRGTCLKRLQVPSHALRPKQIGGYLQEGLKRFVHHGLPDFFS